MRAAWTLCSSFSTASLFLSPSLFFIFFIFIVRAKLMSLVLVCLRRNPLAKDVCDAAMRGRRGKRKAHTHGSVMLPKALAKEEI